MMLKFTILFVTLLAFTDFQSKANAKPLAEGEDDVKVHLLLMIVNIKNHAFNQVQQIGKLAESDTKNFIQTVNSEIEKSWNDIEALQKETGNANILCDKAKDDIKDAALNTIAHFQSCILKIVNTVKTEMSNLAFEGNDLIKEVEDSQTFDEELHNRLLEFDAKSSQFDQHINKLEACKIQSNLIRLKRQISEALAEYKQCIQKK